MDTTNKGFWPCSVSKIDISDGEIDIQQRVSDDGSGTTVVVLDMSEPEIPKLAKTYKNITLKSGFYRADEMLSTQYPRYSENAVFKFNSKTKQFTHFPMEKLRKMVAL